MTLKWVGLAGVVVCLSACTMFQKSPVKGSPEARTEVLSNDEMEITKAQTRYQDAVLKHGEGSDQAVKAKNEWDKKKAQYAADQVHVQQLQRMDSEPRPAVDPSAPTSGNMYPATQR